MAEINSSCDCECLTKYGSWKQKLLSAAQKGHVACVQSYITAEEHKEPRQFMLTRVPVDLAEQGDNDTLECFLKAAAEANVRLPNIHEDCHGAYITPLEIAAHNGRTETVELLLKYGASVNSGTQEPLYEAVNEGYADIVDILLEAGADYEGNDDLTHLVRAAYKDDFHICELLLRAGANVDADSILGTPLMIAVQRRDLQAVKMFVYYEANVDYPDDESAIEHQYNSTSIFETNDGEYFLILSTLLLAADCCFLSFPRAEQVRSTMFSTE